MGTPQQPRTRLLTFNDPHPMRIDRDLAAEIGLNESIVLLQLEYLISISRNKRDGRMWTYHSLPELQRVYFPWWGVMTVQRAIKSLEEKNLIIVTSKYNKLGYDRTQWYALNEQGINSLHSVAIYQNDKSIYQNDRINQIKMVNGSDQNDKTIPESTQRLPETTTESVARKARTPRKPAQASFDSVHEAVALYKELTGKKSIPPVVARSIAETVTDLTHWRVVITTWCGKYRADNVTGMLEWYLDASKMTRTERQSNGSNKPIRQGTRSNFERANWKEGSIDDAI